MANNNKNPPPPTLSQQQQEANGMVIYGVLDSKLRPRRSSRRTAMSGPAEKDELLLLDDILGVPVYKLNFRCNGSFVIDAL